MRVRKFSLSPFPGEGHAPDIRITGSMTRRADRLSVRYSLLGDLAEIAIPAPEPLPARKDRLWEDTCLELFLGLTDSGRYWEINLSPGGNWNVYRFTSRRKGMAEEPAFPSLPFAVRRDPEALRLSLDLDIGKIVPEAQSIEVAVCAILKTVKGGRSHWALVHPAPRPDFHRRDGFRLTFPGLAAR